MLEIIGRRYLFGKVWPTGVSSDRCFEPAVAPRIVEKLEEFLRVVEEQRAKHLRRAPSLDTNATFTGDDV